MTLGMGRTPGRRLPQIGSTARWCISVLRTAFQVAGNVWASRYTDAVNGFDPMRMGSGIAHDTTRKGGSIRSCNRLTGGFLIPCANDFVYSRSSFSCRVLPIPDPAARISLGLAREKVGAKT